MKTCKTCEYRTIESETTVGKPFIFCRRFPPIPISADTAVQPPTDDDAPACGEYEPKIINLTNYIEKRYSTGEAT